MDGGGEILGPRFEQSEIGFIRDRSGLQVLVSAPNLTDEYRGARLYNFDHPVREIAGGNGLEESGIGKDVFRLPKCADRVFAMGGVDRSVASDAGIDHGQQGSWYLNELHTPRTSC